MLAAPDRRDPARALTPRRAAGRRSRRAEPASATTASGDASTRRVGTPKQLDGRLTRTQRSSVPGSGACVVVGREQRRVASPLGEDPRRQGVRARPRDAMARAIIGLVPDGAQRVTGSADGGALALEVERTPSIMLLMRLEPADADRASICPRPYAITYGRMPPREWDASSYDRVSDPQIAMARDVIDRLDLQGDERVLDAGCGTGRVTALVAERVPDGHVIAVDGSEAMVAGDPQRGGIEAFACRPRRARARRARRRDPLDRDLPLDRGPRGACSRACTRRSSPAAGSPRSAAARATSPTSRPRSTPSTSRPSAAGPARGTTPRPRRPRAAPRARRLHRRLDVAAAVAGRARRPARVLHDRDPRLAPRAPARRRARAVRRRRAVAAWATRCARTTCG